MFSDERLLYCVNIAAASVEKRFREKIDRNSLVTRTFHLEFLTPVEPGDYSVEVKIQDAV